MADPSSGTAIWVYAVTRSGGEVADLAADGITGVDGEPARPVEDGGLAAVVGSVDLGRFGEEALRRNLEDLGWLDTVARSHHRVIEAVAARGPVVPMQLAVIYADEGRVCRMLAESHVRLTVALDRVAGRSEWGVKVFASAPVRRAAPDSPPSSGAAYLARRGADLKARERARDANRAVADEIDSALRRISAGARRHPPQVPELSGETRDMLLNAAYLVDDGGRDALAAVVEDLRRRLSDVEIQLTGPWPPYSFSADAPEST